MDIIAKFNLPNYIKGKSFSDASASIAKRFEDRNSPEDIATLNELQGRLQQAQEYVKAEQEKRSSPQGETHQMPDGSTMEGAEHVSSDMSSGGGMKQAGPLGSEPAKESNGYNLGGILQMLGKSGGAGGAAGGADGAAGALGGAGGASGMADKLGTVMDMAKQTFGKSDIDTSGKFDAPEVDSQAAGTMKGAMKGMEAGKSFGPWGAAIGTALGGVSGFVGSGKAIKAANKASVAFANADHNNATNSYKKGGNLLANMYEMGGKKDSSDTNSYSHGGFNEEDNYYDDQNKLNEINNEIEDERLSQVDSFANSLPSEAYSVESFDKVADNKSEDNKSKDDKSEDEEEYKYNPAESLRYAPAAMNIAQLMSLKKPGTISSDRLNTKYNEQLVDERGLQNTVQESVNNNRNAILSSSGGSGSSARASLLASQLQGTKAMSSAYQQATAENRGEKKNAQNFNLGIDKINLQQGNRDTDLNLEQEAAYKTNKSKLLSQLGNDLGGVGKEEMFKRFPELMGLGYDEKGRSLAKKARLAREKKAKAKAKAKADKLKRTSNKRDN